MMKTWVSRNLSDALLKLNEAYALITPISQDGNLLNGYGAGFVKIAMEDIEHANRAINRAWIQDRLHWRPKHD